MLGSASGHVLKTRNGSPPLSATPCARYSDVTTNHILTLENPGEKVWRVKLLPRVNFCFKMANEKYFHVGKCLWFVGTTWVGTRLACIN